MKTYNILFLCTHNFARSIIAEALTTTQTKGKFIGYSAGSTPGICVSPFARELAIEMGYPVDKLRSKSWDEFALPNAPKMDFIITVCDNAAGEVCPVWIGKPVSAHWGLPDPSLVQGTDEEKKQAFKEVMLSLKARVQLLASLPLERLDKMSIQTKLRELSEI